MILLLGGAHSGKSEFATKLALALEPSLPSGKEILYVAPVAKASVSAELQQRMEEQSAGRPGHWLFREPPFGADDLEQLSSQNNVGALVFDGLNLWLGYELTSKASIYEGRALELHCRKELAHLVEILAKIKLRTIVTCGIVNEGLPPAHESGRLMRELLGSATRALAGYAEVVCRLDSGLASTMKLPGGWLSPGNPKGWTPAWNVGPKALAKAWASGRLSSG